MAAKRPSVVEGNTPGKPSCKRTVKGASRRSLFGSNEDEIEDEIPKARASGWTEKEESCLVQYICLFWSNAYSNEWPTTKDMEFWNACAEAVNNACSSTRTGGACRTRVNKHLAVRYTTLSQAEESLNIDYMSNDFGCYNTEGKSTTPKTATSIDDLLSTLSPVFKSSPIPKQENAAPRYVGDVVQAFLKCFQRSMSSRLRMQIMNYIFKLVVVDTGGMEYLNYVSQDFLNICFSSMNTLHEEKKNNLILELCKCFERTDANSQCRMPLDRMPFGLLDYNIRFFASNRTNALGYEEHYGSWLDTMFSQFGHKWLCLHRGPAWQYEVDETDVKVDANTAIKDKGDANIAVKDTADAITTDKDTSDAITTEKDTAEANDETGLNLLMEKALQQSGIDLDTYDGDVNDLHAAENMFQQSSLQGDGNYDESLEMLESSLADFTLSSCSSFESSLSTSVGENSRMCVSEESVSTVDSATKLINLSHLWTHATDDDQNEIRLGNAGPVEMEKHHQVCPTKSKVVQRNPGIFNPLKGKINVASLGPRALQKRVKSSGFSRTVDVQMKVLKHAQKSISNGRWWIKADACDVRKGLRESMRGIWEGDEDFGDGSLQQMYREYKSRKAVVDGLGTAKRLASVCGDLEKVKIEVCDDFDFLTKGNEQSNKLYNQVLEQGHSTEKKLMEVGWDAVEYQELLKKATGLKFEIETMLADKREEVKIDVIEFQVRMRKYLKDLFLKKRLPAKYLLVFMIADELRNRKPYAVPVQFLPYKSITDAKLIELETNLQRVMEKNGMTVVGFTTDGEFNSLRSSGKNRPVSIIGLIQEARNNARSMRKATMTKYFTLDSKGYPLESHPAVHVEDVRWFRDFMDDREEKLEFAEAIHILRRKLFPFMHDPHPWVEGRPEATVDVLKSIMAIYIFRLRVQNLKNDETDPANFSTSLYQPEKCTSSERLHHREDHNHLLKRVVTCLRDGRIPGVDLRHLRAALHDPSTGLTYEALTGKNKQSVPDCERLISTGVISFLDSMSYTSTAKVIRIIHNWHKAVDGRGLTEAVRSVYCKDMKEWLLNDWMPWFKDLPDFSSIDVNRPIKGVCGLTREIVVGLVANLESREIRRQEYVARDLPPEHPRASSSDDCECLFSVMHEMLGNIFDLKQFHDCQPKILNEFTKRINPDLRFYYWTGAKERFREMELPSFNEPPGDGVQERLEKVRISKRGDPGIFVANRASLPQKGELTARAKFHKAPVGLPPHQI